jgi:anti-sigma regulatory factor (Ser/Thr protein kinase)
MELDKDAQEAVRQLGAAINKAIEKSIDVTRAIESLRELGYEPNLTLKLEIALQEIGERVADFDAGENDDIEDIELELTDEDLRTLRRMKIRIE